MNSIINELFSELGSEKKVDLSTILTDASVNVEQTKHLYLAADIYLMLTVPFAIENATEWPVRVALPSDIYSLFDYIKATIETTDMTCELDDTDLVLNYHQSETDDQK